MRKVIGVLLVLAAAVLLVWATNDSDQIRTEVSRVLGKVPSDRPFWLVVGGTASGILGLCLLASRKHRS